MGNCFALISNLDPPPVMHQVVAENGFAGRTLYNRCPRHCPRLFIQELLGHFCPRWTMCLAQEATEMGKTSWSGVTKQVTITVKRDKGAGRERPRGCRSLEEGPLPQFRGQGRLLAGGDVSTESRMQPRSWPCRGGQCCWPHRGSSPATVQAPP